MTYNIQPGNCDENDLLKRKTACLRLAHSMQNSSGDKTANQIVADAQKFWDFLFKTDEDDEEEAQS